MGPRLLLINTATPAGSIALTSGEQVVAELLLNLATPHSDRLLPGIDQLLHATGSTLAGLDALAVVVGPGSFTGLRVGVATAKGLALGAALPLVGISSLQTLACQVPGTTLPVCALLDARKQEVYAGLYQWRDGLPQPLGEERVLDPERLLDELPRRNPLCRRRRPGLPDPDRPPARSSRPLRSLAEPRAARRQRCAIGACRAGLRRYPFCRHPRGRLYPPQRS